MAATLYTQNTIACIWDFDKTLIPEYMQSPLFRRYGVDESTFWAETNALADVYRKRGYHLSGEIGYLNHILTYVLGGQMAGLNNKILRECGKEIKFYPGLPDFFRLAKTWVAEKADYAKHEIQLEHYVVSTGLAEMVRGSAIAGDVEGIWACEFIENPLQPGFLKQKEFEMTTEAEIAQIGSVIDNTGKTRAIFEINKGSNRNPAIDVNSNVRPEDRRSHKLIVSASGLITITGGKWTTYRKMAEDTIDKAITVAGLSPSKCKTQQLLIHGCKTGADYNDHLYVYGSDMEAVLDLLNENPEWVKKLHPRLDYIQAEVIWAVRHEMARKVEDILARRLRALFLDARAAIEMAPTVAKLMAAELQKDEAWENVQVSDFIYLAEGYLLMGS